MKHLCWQGDLYEVKLQSTLGDFAKLVARKMGAGWHPENMRFWLWDKAPDGAARACLPCYVPGAEHAKTPMSAPSLTYAGLQQDRLSKGFITPHSSQAREASLACLLNTIPCKFMTRTALCPCKPCTKVRPLIGHLKNGQEIFCAGSRTKHRPFGICYVASAQHSSMTPADGLPSSPTLAVTWTLPLICAGL